MHFNRYPYPQSQSRTVLYPTIPSSSNVNLSENQIEVIRRIHSDPDTRPIIPVIKQEKYRFIQLTDLQAKGVLPVELTDEQKVLLERLDARVATLSSDDQRQFIFSQQDLIPKYLSRCTTNNQPNRKRSRSSAELFDEQYRRDQSLVFQPYPKRRFINRTDALHQLSHYHIHSKTNPTSIDCDQFDRHFQNYSEGLVKKVQRLQQSIDRFPLVTNSLTSETISDQYFLEKLRLDDLREEVECEKQKKSLIVIADNDDRYSLRREPVMSDDAYFELFLADAS